MRESVEACAAAATVCHRLQSEKLASTAKAEYISLVPRIVDFGSEKTSILLVGAFLGLTGSATADHETWMSCQATPVRSLSLRNPPGTSLLCT